MNKKLFLLPILSFSLVLAGCSLHGGEQQPEEEQPAVKEIWEEDLKEGESSIAQVKAGTAGEYYTVRGTVAANSGSTLAIYRGGEFLYCYNFNSDTANNGGHDKLQEHPLGAYVEIHAQSSAYSGSIQLTAYNVGSKNSRNYDSDAYLTKLADRGETVVPKTAAAEADLGNAVAAGAMMKFNFVPQKDFTFTKDATVNQDLPGKIGEYGVTLRAESYLSADAKAALFGDNGAKFDIGSTYEVTALAAATSSNFCRLLIVDSSTWSLTNAAVWTDPTSVLIEAEGEKTSIEVGQKLQLDFTVMPATAKPVVAWTSEDETVLTVDQEGLVTAHAVGVKHIYATASKGDVSVRGEYEITVVPASKTITLVKSPAAGVTYKAGIHQTSKDGKPIYYINGGYSGSASQYVNTTTEVDDAIDVQLEAVSGQEGKFYLKCTIDGATKYGNIVVDGSYVNFKYQDTAATAWSLYELEGTEGVKTLSYTVSGCSDNTKNVESYLGTYNANTTLSISQVSRSNATKIDAESSGQYPLHFYTVA